MSFNWDEFCAWGHYSIGDFVETVVYCDQRQWGTDGLGANIPLGDIDDIVTKQSIVLELELTLLLRKEFCLRHGGTCTLSAGRSSMDMDEALEQWGKYIQDFELYIAIYKADTFPILPSERAHMDWIEIKKRVELFGSVKLPKKYPLKEMLQALLRFHEENTFTAPRSLLVYLGQLTDAQDVLMHKEAMASPDDDKDMQHKAKPSHLKIIHALFTELKLPVKKENSHTVGILKKALEIRGVKLDPKTITTLLWDLERVENKKGKHNKFN